MKSIFKKVTFAIILLAYLAVTGFHFSDKLDWSTHNICVVVISIVVVIMCTVLLKRRLVEIKNGVLDEDEMTKKIKIYTGHYAFTGSFFLNVLIFLVANLNHVEIDAKADGILALGIFGSLLIYVTVYFYLNKSGVTNE